METYKRKCMKKREKHTFGVDRKSEKEKVIGKCKQK